MGLLGKLFEQNKAKEVKSSPDLSGLKHSQSTVKKPNAEVNRVGTSFLVVSKDMVMKKDFSDLLKFIDSVSLPQIKSGNSNYSKLVLTIEGYDNDSRSLWEIPEVVEWYKELHIKYPYIPLFLSPGSVHVYFMILKPIIRSIVPDEYRDKNDFTNLLLHTFAESNKFFSNALGSDDDRYKDIKNLADESFANAVTNLVQGIKEPI